ncbi:MAG: septum formation inhibitor Maf [Proteobacteria bacterium SG_bin9]|nr:MAG: septum formation inhibitor Maf [Proteobacteria bacterium SG_bin9]
MSIWRGENPLVLASQSRARQMLLGNAGLSFEALPADIDERGVVASAKLSDPIAIARHLAREKAIHVSQQRAGQFVIGADQTLALGSRQFNKPAGRAQAAEQLAALAGKTHELHSAVCVVSDSKVLFDHVSSARLTVRSLTASQIDAYLDVAGDKVTTSVGAYQLEGLGIHLFERIEGDHFTILGLPLLPLLDFLRGRGLLAI